MQTHIYKEYSIKQANKSQRAFSTRNNTGQCGFDLQVIRVGYLNREQCQSPSLCNNGPNQEEDYQLVLVTVLWQLDYMGREDADRPQNHCYFTVRTGSNQTSCGGNPATSWTVCTEKWAQSSQDFLLLHLSLAIIHLHMSTNGGQEGNQDKMVILGAGSGAPASHVGVPGAESHLCCCSGFLLMYNLGGSRWCLRCLRCLPPTWETWKGFLDLGFGLA